MRGAVIIVVTAWLVPSLAFAEGAAHTSDRPQTLPFKPYNLYSLLEPHDLVAEVERRARAPDDWSAHLERVTRGLVAAPYLLSALGEGRGVDKDPRFRLDAFDCTTFVETAIALAHCDDLGELSALLDQIRYVNGKPSFQSRRHLITSQWIPGLTAAGYLRDVTRRLGGERTRFIGLRLTPRRWKRRKIARQLPLEPERVPYGTYTLPYLTIEDALKQADRLPLATIVSVVRVNWPRSPDVVTHQGLIIRRPDSPKRFVRHASPVSKRVIDEPLEHMLRRYLKPRKWPIVGVNLLQIRRPERTSRPVAAQRGAP